MSVDIDSPGAVPLTPARRSPLQRLTSLFVQLFERYTPNPYILAVGLTILTGLLAAVLAPKGSLPTILSGWYSGLFSILAFAFQVLLILVAGYALSTSRPVRSLLSWLASFGSTPRRAIVVTIVTVFIASFLNWGFGLVVAGLLTREIAKRIRIDFGWLVGGAYSGWMIFSSGFSSSIALSQATPGSSLNILQKITGQVLPLESMLFTPLNLVTTFVLLIALPLLYCAIQPGESDVQIANLKESAGHAEASSEETKGSRTLARKLEEAWILNLILVVAGIGALGLVWHQNGFSLDLNSVIFLFLIAGLLLHWRPIAYVNAINDAARVTGPLILQYPIYGGVMGI
ncbi:MAG TPA: TIGR00366 family protein, partial [Chthoniobacterales bacterium]|nr:TIGR00366 family protein [Chthoniobacterales bacterium]